MQHRQQHTAYSHCLAYSNIEQCITFAFLTTQVHHSKSEGVKRYSVVIHVHTSTTKAFPCYKYKLHENQTSRQPIERLHTGNPMYVGDIQQSLIQNAFDTWHCNTSKTKYKKKIN